MPSPSGSSRYDQICGYDVALKRRTKNEPKIFASLVVTVGEGS